MRWAVRRVASLTARERERLFRQHSTNRIARRMDRIIGKLYTSAKFSVLPVLAPSPSHQLKVAQFLADQKDFLADDDN